MLQFEFDIREYKINNNKSKGIQLALGISFLITAILFFIFKNYLEFLSFNEYIVLGLVILAMYFIGLLLGCKLLYPKEYLSVNHRKLTYKIGWGKKELKVYLKDITEISMENQYLILLLKNKEQLRIDLSHISENAKSVLKNYLNI